jgi:hypothetical protein
MTMTPDQLRAFADRCEERATQGLMISPAAVATVVEALRLLAVSRETKPATKRKP